MSETLPGWAGETGLANEEPSFRSQSAATLRGEGGGGG